MSVDEVDAIRDKSAEKNRARKDKDGRPIITGPWADHYIEMGRKTVLRRLFKYLPISIESLAFAGAIDGHAVAQAAPIDEIAFDVALEDDAPTDQPRQIEQQASTPIPQPMQQPAGEWQPSPEEVAAIQAQEMAEAGQQPAPRGRRERGGMNVE